MNKYQQIAKRIVTASRVLDVGCGAGDLGRSLNGKQCNVTGWDLKLDRVNANREAYQLLEEHDIETQGFGSKKYDVIVSNPPYIELLNFKYLEKDIVNFEPKLALSGGFDGFSEIKKVIKKASRLIKKNGKFILEIGFNQKNRVIDKLKKEGFYINKAIKDYGNNDRCIISTKI